MDQRLVKSILFDPILWQNFYTFRLVAAGKEEVCTNAVDLMLRNQEKASAHFCREDPDSTDEAEDGVSDDDADAKSDFSFDSCRSEVPGGRTGLDDEFWQLSDRCQERYRARAKRENTTARRYWALALKRLIQDPSVADLLILALERRLLDDDEDMLLMIDDQGYITSLIALHGYTPNFTGQQWKRLLQALAAAHWQRKDWLPNSMSHQLQAGIDALITFSQLGVPFFSALSELLASLEVPARSKMALLACLLPPIIHSEQALKKSALDVLAIMLRKHDDSLSFLSLVCDLLDGFGSKDIALLFVPSILSIARKLQVPTNSDVDTSLLPNSDKTYFDEFVDREAEPNDQLTNGEVLEETSRAVETFAEKYDIRLQNDHEDEARRVSARAVGAPVDVMYNAFRDQLTLRQQGKEEKTWRMAEKEMRCFECQGKAHNRCAGCGGPVYCSRTCQEVAWEKHKHVCKPWVQQKKAKQ